MKAAKRMMRRLSKLPDVLETSRPVPIGCMGQDAGIDGKAAEAGEAEGARKKHLEIAVIEG
jgi:hypothetical protein